MISSQLRKDLHNLMNVGGISEELRRYLDRNEDAVYLKTNEKDEEWGKSLVDAICREDIEKIKELVFSQGGLAKFSTENRKGNSIP